MTVRTKPLNLRNPDKFASAIDEMMAEREERKWFPSHKSGTGGTGGDNVLCGCIRDDGSKITSTYPCHKPILGYNKAEVLWSCFGWRTSEKIAKYFHHWLCYESPWSKLNILPDLEEDFMFSHGFVFKNLDKTPANLLHNFLVASRAAVEWQDYVEPWYETINTYNTDPALTFLMTTCFVNLQNNQKSPFIKGCTSAFSLIDKYDWPLDTGRCTEEYVMNFLQGKAIGLSKKMFYPSATTAPVNTLWGEIIETDTLSKKYNSELQGKRYINMLKKLYEDKYGVKSSSSFGSTSKVFSYEETIQILLEEQERLLD